MAIASIATGFSTLATELRLDDVLAEFMEDARKPGLAPRGSHFAVVLEDLVEPHVENPRYPECDLQRWRVLVAFNRVHRLPRHSDPVRQLLLRHLGVVKPKGAD